MIEQDRWACDRIEIMLWLSRCLIAVLLLSGCYKSVGSEDKESDAGGSGTDTNTGTDGDSDSDIDSDVDTDTDTDSDSDGDADNDTDTDADTDTDSDSDMDTETIEEDTSWSTDPCLVTEDCGEEECQTPNNNQCWFIDAMDENLTCRFDSECPPDGPNNPTLKCIHFEKHPVPGSLLGICACHSHDNCSSGLCIEGMCRPSYCNGYYFTSMWGCSKITEALSCATPAEICADTDAGYPGYCCEGAYPANVTNFTLGGCSASPDCAGF